MIDIELLEDTLNYLRVVKGAEKIHNIFWIDDNNAWIDYLKDGKFIRTSVKNILEKKEKEFLETFC